MSDSDSDASHTALDDYRDAAVEWGRAPWRGVTASSTGSGTGSGSTSTGNPATASATTTSTTSSSGTASTSAGATGGQSTFSHDRLEAPDEPPALDQWCHCQHCVVWPEALMNVCCHNHAVWHTKDYGGASNVNCITECDVIADLLRPAPLRVMYNNYQTYHVPRYQDAERLLPSNTLPQAEINRRVNAQRRLAAYRSLVFWTYPDIRRRERRPLPSCLYAMVRALYPSDENEDVWADLQHTVFVAEPDDD